MSPSTSQSSSSEGGEHPAGTVVADMSMSLDGFVADRDDGVDCVFAWASKPQPPRKSPADRGLVDRVQVSLVPLLLGSGIRMFENLAQCSHRA
jgi:hypothetical protein